MFSGMFSSKQISREESGDEDSRSRSSSRSSDISCPMSNTPPREKGRERTVSQIEVTRSPWSFSVRKALSGRYAKATVQRSSIVSDAAAAAMASHEPFSSSLDFLNLGFEELVKCRQVLLILLVFVVCFLFLSITCLKFF